MSDDQRPTVERKPAEVTFPAVPLVDGSGAPVRRVKLAVAVAALVVVAAVGSNLLGAGGDAVGIGAAVHSPSSLFSTYVTPSPNPAVIEIDPGSYGVPWPQGRIRLTMPPGWLRAVAGSDGCCWSPQAGTTITRRSLDDPSPTLTLNLVHDVTSVVADVCVEGGREAHVAVGPTAEDLTTALANQVGTREVAAPTSVTLGGYPATRLVLTYPSECPGPEGRLIWANANSNGFALLKDGRGTVYVVDVNGDRLVITSLERGSTAEEITQLDGIIASIEIEPSPVHLPIGRQSVVVDGIPLSIEVTTSTEGGWARYGNVYIAKSIVGPQDAEGMIYWASSPGGIHFDPCGQVLNLPVGASAADVAGAVSSAPGTELLSGPSDVTVGGHPAVHVVVTVREDLGCDPGYFYTWRNTGGGPFWAGTSEGDTIGVWIVDVTGKRLFIAGETHENAGLELDQEIQQIVDSIQFK